MAKEYLDRLTTLMQQVTPGQFEDVSLKYEHFFGGAAAYADGRICVTLTPAGFAVKLPEESRERLRRDHAAKRLRYFPEGPVKKDYVVLPDRMVEDVEALRHWVAESVQYALTLPKPATKRSK